jgi:hypothetical protein
MQNMDSLKGGVPRVVLAATVGRGALAGVVGEGWGGGGG